MPDNETTIWGIHAGKGGIADDLFLKRNADLDSNYKALLPLKRTYVPAPEEEAEE